MSSAQDFLRKQHEELQSELERAQSALRQAQQEVIKVEERIKYCEELLQQLEQEKVARRKERAESPQAGATTADLAKQIIEKYGPLKTQDIHKRLEELGKVTSVNSLYTILSRQKGKMFDKNQEGIWSIKVKDGSSEPEAVSNSRGGMDER